MRLLNSFPFVLFLISFIPTPCKTLSQNSNFPLPKPFLTFSLGSMVTDLESTTPSDFATEGDDWVYKNLPCPFCLFSIPSGSSCGSAEEAQIVYGGPTTVVRGSGLNYLERDYANPGPAWNQIGLEFDLWIFTTSELFNAATLITGDLLFIRMGSNYAQPTQFTLTSSCSTNFVSAQGSHIRFIYKYHIQSFSSISTSDPLNFGVQIPFGSAPPPPTAIESFGLRNLKIFNLNSQVDQGYANFPCNALSRWDGVTCSACHASCQSCFGPNDGQCTTCQSNYFDYGNGTCLTTACSGIFQQIQGTNKCTKKCATGFYWARNQSCVGTCEEPLVQSSDENGFAVCSSPCSDTAQFVYPDRGCSAICSAPLKQRNEATIRFCLNLCLTSGGDVSSLYLYPDGSCKSACDSPLTSQMENSLRFCVSPCNPSDPTMYLYPDGSCDTCPTPLSQRTEQSIQYCDHPCAQNKPFLNQNRGCQETCPSPSITKVQSIGKFCQLPCANENHYLNTQNGKCTETCEYPDEAIESPLPKLCKPSLSEEEVKQVQQMAETVNNVNSASSTGAMIWSVISSSDSTSACLGPLAKMLQYIKFMDIKFPEKVLILMDEQNRDALKGGFAKKMLGEALDKFPRHELPMKFEFYEIPSSFFVNLWPAFFNLSVILMVTLVAILLTAATKEYLKMNNILKSLTEILRWNVFLVTFCGSICDIILYTALEFETMQFDNAQAIFSFTLCLAINALVVLVVVKILDVNSEIRECNRTAGGDPEEQKKMIEQKWSSYRALFECYKDYSFYQQIFLFVFVMRMALFNAAIGYLYNYPLFQAVTAVVANVLMLLYLVIKRPMKKLVNLIQQVILELVLLPFNVSVLALAIMDDYAIAELDLRRSFGDVIVYINLIVPILSLVLMAAKAIVMAVDLYSSWRLAKVNKTKKLVGVQRSFYPNDILNTTKEKLAASDQTQILDLTDQSTLSIERHSVRSNSVIYPRRRSSLENFLQLM